MTVSMFVMPKTKSQSTAPILKLDEDEMTGSTQCKITLFTR